MSDNRRISDIISDSDWDSPEETSPAAAAGPSSRRSPEQTSIRSNRQSPDHLKSVSYLNGYDKKEDDKSENQKSEKSIEEKIPTPRKEPVDRGASPLPPYDFSEALPDEGVKNRHAQYKSPGKSKKGNIYEPESHDFGWDDSDVEAERTLANLRVNFERNKQREGESSTVATPRKREEYTPRSDRLPTPGMDVNEKSVAEEDPRMRSVFATPTDVKILTDQLPLIYKSDRSVYCFEESHHGYYQVNTAEEKAVMTGVADRTEKWLQRGFREVFGVLRIVVMFFTIFITQLLHFCLQHIFQPLIIGVFSLAGDFLVKPLLSTFFNNLVQPALVLFWNVLSGVQRTVQPVIEIISTLIHLLATLLRAVRLVEINWKVTSQPFKSREKAVHEI